MKLSDLPKVPTHECENGCYIDNMKVKTDGYGETYCPRCDGNTKLTGYRDAKWFSIAEYEVSRAYGGAEEGGWYYDTGTREDMTLRCYDAGDATQIPLYIEMMKHRAQGDRPIFRIYAEEVAPTYFPRVRPRYC